MPLESRDKAWSILLFTLSLAYLAFELAFNSRIVDGASGVFNASLLSALEFQGRILSGIGLSLLVAKTISPKKLIPFLRMLIIACSISFCFMFFGQKILVEYLVDNSTAEERSNAQYIALLKKGIISNNVQLEDISIPEDQLDTPATKAMTSIMGAMIFNSDTFITHLKASADSIVALAAKNDAEKTWEEAYFRYQSYQKEVISTWAKYNEGVNAYNTEMRSVNQKAHDKANEIYVKAGTQFKGATKGKINREIIIQKSLELKRAVNDYYDAKEFANTRCKKYNTTEQKCHIKIENTYRDIVIKNAGRYIPPDYWCYPPIEKSVEIMVRGRVRLITKEVADCKTMTRKWFEKKLITASKKQTTLSDNIKVANKIIDELSKEGVILPRNWTMKEKSILVDKLAEQGKASINEEYKKNVFESLGEYVPPTLNQDEFLNHSLIQTPIKDKLEWKSNENISLTLDADQFFEQLHYPHYETSFMEEKERLMVDVQSLGDGQSKEKEGRDYYRSIIVPPMAMSFSLFFGILNLFSIFGICCVIVFKNKIIANSVSVGSLTLVFFVYPLVFPSKTVESKAFTYFQSELEKDFPKLVSYASAWVVDTQPIMYPLGHNIAKIIRQDAVETYLTKIEKPITENNNEISESGSLEIAKEEHLSPIESTKDINESKISNGPKKPIDSVQVVYRNQSVGEKTIWPYSIALLDYTKNRKQGIYFDISPIGKPVNEDWVVFNKSIFRGNVCVPGKRKIDSLYHMNSAAWRNATHGPCNTDNKVKVPTVGAYLRKINRTFADNVPVMISFNESLISEVRCDRYTNIINKVNEKLTTSKLTVSTSSISVLGCFHNIDKNINTAFKIPSYSKDGKNLLSNDHSKISFKEWQRLKTLEKGGEIKLSSLSTEHLTSLLNNHEFLDAVLIDNKFLNKENKALLSKQQISTFIVNETKLIRGNN